MCNFITCDDRDTTDILNKKLEPCQVRVHVSQSVGNKSLSVIVVLTQRESIKINFTWNVM